jgi:phytoene dehydrogenase-like protein
MVVAMMSTARPPVLIVGAGLAGLACAWRLTQLGRACVVVEASDAVGGRVRTDWVDGFRLDRGFQVLLTAYPRTATVIDVDRLDLRPFKAGAIVRRGGRFLRAFDPLRHPTEAISTAATPLVSLGDKLRLGKLWAEVLAATPDELLTTGPERSTEDELAARGFSDDAVEAFFRPFFGGVFLQSPLTTSSRFFRYTFRMFATGRAAVPADGMGAIPQQLADRLTAAGVRIRLNAPVVERSTTGVTLDTGERLAAGTVVVATDLAAAQRLLPDLPDPAAGAVRSACTVWFDAPTPVVGSATLVLNGDGPADGPVNHLAEMSAVSNHYAPPGRTLVAASVLAPPADDADLTTSIRDQMRRWVGPPAADWRLLRVDRIPFALPPADPPTMYQPRRPVRLAEGLFVCGDHRDQPSIEGAITSGLRTADAVAASRH